LARASYRRTFRLSRSRRILVPFARGVRRPEVCLPQGVVTDLSPEQQEVVLAHELAHVLRKDVGWLVLARLVEGVFFFQPLNRLARKRLQRVSEFRCDDWAVANTGRPVSLAKCLTRIADWAVKGEVPVLAASMAGSGGSLGVRVRRLLDRSYPMPDGGIPRWLGAICGSLLLVVCLAVPGFSRTPDLRGPEAPPAPEVSAPALPSGSDPDTAPKAEAPEPTAEPEPTASPEPAVEPRPAAAPEPTREHLGSRVPAPAAPAPPASSEVTRHRELEHQEAEMERLAHAAELDALSSQEELERIEAEVRRALESIPEAEELARIAMESLPSLEELARIREEALPSPEEMERIEAEVRRALESIPSHEELSEILEDALLQAQESMLKHEELEQVFQDYSREVDSLAGEPADAEERP